MATFPQPPHMTVEEYFELCRNNPDTRYEYMDGQVTMLVGGSLNHARIALNIASDLSQVNLSRADLSQADLSQVNLSQANLEAANLSGADLRDVNLRSANLSGANLSGANLTDAIGITAKELEKQAWSLRGITMPNGSKHS
jgi:uncharacterized protein YjbI with pentapeptide repeats